VAVVLTGLHKLFMRGNDAIEAFVSCSVMSVCEIAGP
jgi:hypothetical protein